MALFLTRFKTFVAGVSQITVADMHRLQDELIAINEWKDAEESSFLGSGGNGPSATHLTNGRITTGTAATTNHPITGLPAGVQITSIDFTSFGAGVNDATITLHQYVSATDTVTDHGNTTASAIGPPDVDTIAAINKTLLAGAIYYVSCAAGAGDDQTISGMTVHWKRI